MHLLSSRFCYFWDSMTLHQLTAHFTNLSRLCYDVPRVSATCTSVVSLDHPLLGSRLLSRFIMAGVGLPCCSNTRRSSRITFRKQLTSFQGGDETVRALIRQATGPLGETKDRIRRGGDVWMLDHDQLGEPNGGRMCRYVTVPITVNEGTTSDLIPNIDSLQ
ncbi:hypothetical protein BV22DRAFT_923024 [Leucogyrophana mollusca]|uniref:Uncharacterized protein n=1 Tax=Leucogyrophana mollusca TaxID=85980 RepID=A0ACB8AZT5_9AGAM|nr:hypothetical protein BV22DRAFT_923024 [Leucogyrophana mollusca]